MANMDVRSLGDSSLVLRDSQTNFDVQNETDVISLLRTVHQNALDPDLKNHIRDVIFSYRQSKSEADLIELQNVFTPLGVTIATSTASQVRSEPVPQTVPVSTPLSKPTTLGMGRTAPRFVGTVKPADVVSKPAPVVARVVEESVTEPKPIGVPSYSDVAVSEVPTAPVVETVHVPTVEAVTPAVASSFVNPSERIAEIKRLVNEKVGNPVNLIDAHNEEGREYMNALLDAMKKSNGGQQGEASEAMERLEKAFARVQEIVGDVPMNTMSAPTPVAVASQAVESRVTQIEEEKPPISVSESNPVKINVITTPTEEVSVPSVAPTVVASTMSSVAQAKQIQDQDRALHQKEIAVAEAKEAEQVATMDPLMTPQVTAGLGQLLSEWSLFKSSGIFGTGPSGKDHVLYVKLAPLTMTAVISGRFDGATPKIKQSIADYMNGWRYEEGVVHEHGETFEHYLRRVIYHILNKSK